MFLKHPLVLMGFVIMLIFSVHEKILEKGIIPPLTAEQGNIIVQLILAYGFQLGVLIVILGFAWQFYKTGSNGFVVILIVLLGFGLLFYQNFVEKEVKTNTQAAETSHNINQIVATLVNKHQSDVQVKDEQIIALTEAVTALSKGQDINASQSELKAALAALAKGNTTMAKSLFARTAEKAEQQAKQGAEALRNLGALAFLDNTQEAVQAYRRATQLDPDNADGWNKLGLLLMRVGDLTEAITSYNTVLALGEQHDDKGEIANAYGNLGIIYAIRGELDKARAFFQKALTLDKALGRKEGMANAYSNLGTIYKIRGELDNANAFYQKALKLYQAIGNKEGVANAYSNLGSNYQTRGELDKAFEFNQKSLKLNQALGDKAGMASNYLNLGLVYKTRDELDKAIVFYQKALNLNQALGRKEGMANQYGNLGNVYKLQGNKVEAKRYYLMSLELFKQLGSPNTQTIQTKLNELIWL